MNKRGMIWAVTGCLLLSGCGGEAPPVYDTVSALEQAAGVAADTVFLRIDEREVPAWEYLYWLALDCQQLSDRAREAGEPLDWSADGGEWETLAKSAALEDTALCVTVETWAETYGCTLTEEELDALPLRESRYLTESQSRKMAALGQMYGALYALYRTPGSALAPAAGELDLFQTESGLLAAEWLQFSAGGDRETARRQAEEAFAALNNAADREETFAALLREHGGTISREDWTPLLQQAAEMLKPGQFSGILETETGFVILRRLSVDEEALWEAHFDSLLLAAAEQSSIWVSEMYEELSPAAFWAALSQAEEGTKP